MAARVCRSDIGIQLDAEYAAGVTVVCAVKWNKRDLRVVEITFSGS